MHMSTKLTREPRQARSRETLSRIVEATLALIRESLDGDFTLREVADRADIARGTLHARFPSKEELLIHVHEIFWTDRVERLARHLDEVVAIAAALPAEAASRRAALAPAVSNGLALLLADQRKTRAVHQVFARAMIDSARLASRHRHFQTLTFDLVIARANAALGHLGAPIVLDRMRWALRVVVAAMRESQPELVPPGLRLDDAVLIAELGRIVLDLVPDP
jgi:AcrR family transcriptional regulator